ncbi:ATP-binding cassette domain-containing protein [Hahella sp. SMD15-11]|uniref:ATP-binding cassette domain-containing protein n=1 Tax=Thermohahella caldifontis TaxID=3142973 RepID=A0AB39UUT3_9GAMM
MTPPLIQLSDVCVRLSGKTILQHIHLELLPGRITTVIGPNGAGKSTLARVVLGLLSPCHGRVVRKPGLRLGYVPQRFHVDSTLPLTVDRFLSDCPSRPDLDRMLAPLHLDALARHDLSALSGGQLQKVLLARALRRQPELLVLDEPAQGVDMAGQTLLYELVEEAVSRLGCGVLLISHDLHWVMSSTSEVICLNGHICCSGQPHSLVGNPNFNALFGAQGHRYALFRHDHKHHKACDPDTDTSEAPLP